MLDIRHFTPVASLVTRLFATDSLRRSCQAVARLLTLSRIRVLHMGAEEAERAEVCVLVVDDDRDTADTSVIVLNQFGLVSLAAYDAQHALKLAENFHPRVVLLDLAMPRIDGYHLARDLRCLAGMDSAVLIAISGYGADNDRRQSRAAGCDHHFLKPVDWDEMIVLLRSISARQNLSY